MRSAKPASRRRSRFSVASSALRVVRVSLLLGELVAAGGERGGASGELVEVEQPGLVGVEQPGAFAFVGVERGVEAFELSGDQLVLVGWVPAMTARSPAISCLGSSSAWRTCAKT